MTREHTKFVEATYCQLECSEQWNNSHVDVFEAKFVLECRNSLLVECVPLLEQDKE